MSISLLRNLQEKLIKCGFELSIQHVFSMCYVEKEHYNMFYYNGGVEKCDKRPIGNLRGHLNSEGDIVWTEKPIFSDYDLFDENAFVIIAIIIRYVIVNVRYCERTE